MNTEERFREHLSKIALSYGHHPGKTPEEAAYFYIGPPEEVVPGLFFFTSIGNSITFDCGDRLFQVDCNTVFLSPGVIADLRSLTQKPIDTIAITHGHVDHLLGAVNYIKDNKDRGYTRPTVIAHRRLRDRINRYKRFDAYRKTTDKTQFQVQFDQSDLFVYPDVEFEDRIEITVNGEIFLIRYGNGHTDDSSWVYAPRFRALCTGDLFQWTAPNVGNPLKTQRYAKENAEALEEMAALRPEILFPGHGPKITGVDKIEKALLTTARYLRYVEDHVVSCMNQGMWEEEIVQGLKIPDDLYRAKWVPPVYGHPSFIARGVYRRYGGYYSGNPAELFPPPKEEKAKAIVELAGGSENVLSRARALIEAEKDELACQLAEWVVQADPQNVQGWELYGLLFMERAAAEGNMQARGIFNSAVRNALTALERLKK